MQLTEKQKYEIIILYDNNYTTRQISKKMNINRNSVNLWIKRYNETKSIDRQIGSGRKEKLTIDQQKIITNKLKENDLITAKNIKVNIENENIFVSTSTIINILHKNGFNYKLPKLKPLLNEEHKKKD